jgi:hypothetical protein
MDDDAVPHANLSREEREWRKERAAWNRFILQKLRSSYENGGVNSRDMLFWRSMLL